MSDVPDPHITALIQKRGGGIVPGVDGRAAGGQGAGGREAAVVRQRRELGIGIAVAAGTVQCDAGVRTDVVPESVIVP